MYVCTYMCDLCACVYADAIAFATVLKVRGSLSSSCFLSVFLRQSFSLSLELSNFAGLASQSPRSACLWSPTLKCRHVSPCYAFSMDAGNLNSLCTASTLPTEPSSQLPGNAFYKFDFLFMSKGVSLCTTCGCRCPRRPGVVGSLGTGVIKIESCCGCWELSLGPHEQQKGLPADPSLQLLC